jgi:hypothetical protein
VVFDKPLEDVIRDPINYNDSASPCHFRLLDCTAILDERRIRIIEYPDFPPPEVSYAAISYPWRDLQLHKDAAPPEGCFGVVGAEHADAISVDVLRTACTAASHFGVRKLWLDRLCILQENKEDKNWQIQRMFKVYSYSDPCLIFPGGLVRLASLDEPTTWIDRAWTLQEAAANPNRDSVKLVFSFPHADFQEFAQRFIPLGYTPEFISSLDRTNKYLQYIIEPSRSAACNLHQFAFRIAFGTEALEYFNRKTPSHGPTTFPIRMISHSALKMLKQGIAFDKSINRQFLWMSAFVRTSSRPVDMIFSIMGLMGVEIPVSQFGPDDRVNATIALMKELTNRHRSAAVWLFIAPEMPPSEENSLLPTFPRTSESGRAEIQMKDGRLMPAVEVVGLSQQWKTDGAPVGTMNADGYFTFQARGALVLPSTCDAVDVETWAVVIGERRELNRNPETGQIQTSERGKPWPAIVELTLMFVEKNDRSCVIEEHGKSGPVPQVDKSVSKDNAHTEPSGEQLFHRIGMEHEIDKKKTSNWTWVERTFCVGGPGKGVRVRFAISNNGPVYS